jgi:asparaginyl-tRNA synthetase
VATKKIQAEVSTGSSLTSSMQGTDVFPNMVIQMVAIGEEAGNLFSTDYFDLGKAYLAQTGQLYVEAAAAALGKVYCFGPTFRAEKSKTRRHLTEFWMVEPEVAFNDSNDNMRLQEAFVSSIVARVLDRRKAELAELERDTSPLERVTPPFERISYTDAVTRLNHLGSDLTWGQDLGGDDETLLAREYDRPVFVYNYPKDVKAFYMKENPDDPRTVLNNDMLAPEGYGEIIGGSQREDDYDKLLARIRAEKLPEAAYAWYLDLRKYGTFVHAGFGLGVERTVAWICGIPHIREAIAFPRTLYRLWP